MRNAKPFSPLLGLLGLLMLGLPGCQPLATDPPTPPGAGAGPDRVEMRAYRVPPSVAGELSDVLNRLMYTTREQAPTGTAQVGPGGLLLVTGPIGVHAGLEAMLKELGDRSGAAPPTVQVTYWMVQGRPGAGELAPELQEIAPALQTIAKEEGPRAFTLVEKLRVRQLSGNEGNVQGTALRVEQNATARDGMVLARLALRRTKEQGELVTQVGLPPGKLLVLGQAGGDSAEAGARGPDVYYIVRAEVLDGVGG